MKQSIPSSLQWQRTGTLTLTNSLSGSGGFTNRFNATVTLGGTNAMDGPISIQIGMLSFSNAPAQGGSTNIVLDSSQGTSANSRLGFTGGIHLPSANCIRTDAGTFTIASSGNTWAGTLVAVGRLRLGAINAVPSVPFSIGQGTGTNAILDLNGFNQQIPGITSVHGANANTPVVANISSTANSILTLSVPGGVYGGAIQDSINGSLRKVGLTIVSGAQQLTGACTYSGPTTILAGGLVLKGAGSLPSTAVIDITAPAALDVSLRADATFALNVAQTLKGTGSSNITGNLVSQGTIELKADKAEGVIRNDQLAVSGRLTCDGKLKLTLSGETLTAGDALTLFTAPSYAPAGFATLEPPSPGPGLIWDASTLATDGTLRVAGPVKGADALSPSGTEILFSGSGGVPHGAFTAVTSTDILEPLARWAAVQTGAFDAGGNFSVTVPFVPGEPTRFFGLRIP